LVLTPLVAYYLKVSLIFGKGWFALFQFFYLRMFMTKLLLLKFNKPRKKSLRNGYCIEPSLISLIKFIIFFHVARFFFRTFTTITIVRMPIINPPAPAVRYGHHCLKKFATCFVHGTGLETV